MALGHQASSADSSRSSLVAARAAAAAANGALDSVPSFSVEDGSLDAVSGAPPADQPNGPAMRSVKPIHSDDGRVTCGVWDCQAGVFEVAFKCDEIVHILEGEVIVRSEGSAQAQTLRRGDVAFFRKGLTSTWEVPRYVRKLWFHHFPKPTVRERIEYKLRMLLGALPQP